MLGFLNGVPGKLATLVSRLNSARAGYLDNLSAGPVAQASTALSTANWTNARAVNLDYLPVYKNKRIFLSSGSFVTPFAGKYRIRVLGAGGSGPIRTEAIVTGGGGGGYSEAIGASLSSGVTLTVTVGTAGKVNGSVSTQAGVAGTASSVSGSGLTTLTANGGSAGNYGTSGSTVNGGAGGTASGGDINYSGGRGGNVPSTVTTNYRIATGGGGAASYLGVGGRGGDFTGTYTYSNNCASTGGGGVIGTGGDITSLSNLGTGGGGYTSGIANSSTAGLSYTGDAHDISRFHVISDISGFITPVNGFTHGRNHDGTTMWIDRVCSDLYGDPLYPLLGAGNIGFASAATQQSYYPGLTGGGGGGRAAVTNDQFDTYGGTCGGGGGYASHNMTTRGSIAGRGAGGGGVNGSTISSAKSEGGDGLVIIEW